jgi:hypothetical protein
VSGADPEDPREALLGRLVRDVRRESTPELDWSGLEDRLLRQVRQAPATSRRSFYPLAWGGLAPAAALALWFAAPHRPHAVAPPAPGVAVAESLTRSGDGLSVGSRVEALEREVSVTHSGRATWTLAPNSSALLAGRDERITVRLERGSVLSRVVPNPKPETFVIEAAAVRIAVHGTVFRVALGPHVVVDVREGIVGVGPLHAAPAFFLKAGSHGDFALDGRSGSIDGKPVGEPSSSPSEPAEHGKPGTSRAFGSPAPSGSTAPADSAKLPNEPSIEQIEAGITNIVEATSDCFTRYTQSAEGVRITAHTALSLKILASGDVADVDFQPPLSPEAEACAAASISQVRFAASKNGARVTRMLELKR